MSDSNGGTAIASGALGEGRNDADPLEIRRDEGVAAFRHAAPLESHGAATASKTTSYSSRRPPGGHRSEVKRGGSVDLGECGGGSPDDSSPPPRPPGRAGRSSSTLQEVRDVQVLLGVEGDGAGGLGSEDVLLVLVEDRRNDDRLVPFFGAGAGEMGRTGSGLQQTRQPALDRRVG